MITLAANFQIHKNMLHDKGIKSIKELQADFHFEKFDIVKLTGIFKAMKLTESFSEFDHFKQSGYSFKFVLSLLSVTVVMANKTVLSSLTSLYDHGITIGKDVFYRLKNNEHISWRRILWHISMKFIHITESNKPADDSEKPHYLIFDDTTMEKSGKKMEFLGRVWDHVKQRSVLGFKILVMLYWDGKSSIPLDFSIHREKGKRETRPYGMSQKELRRQYSRERSKESESSRRIKELDGDKISMMLKMFNLAVSRCLRVDYVLVDSWFTCDALIKAVVRHGIHLIGMYKIAKAKFQYQGKMANYSEINNRITKVIRCRSLRYYYKRADVMYGDMRLTLYFSRRGKRGNWKVLLTTDTNLSFIKLIEHYQVRWTIEVFNKEAKSLLHLGGCQSSNFDAQIADTTISMIAYILLSLRFRYEHYESKGALFRSMNAECLRMTLDRRLWGLFLETIRVIAELLDIDADDLLRRVLTNAQAEQMLNLYLENGLKQAG
jgi:predicted nucleic acid-binding Zn finger protein